MDIEQLVKDLTPNILSMELIEKEKLIAENLFEIKIDGKILGPFSGLYLKNAMAGKEIEHILVKNMESIIWIPMAQHPLFQTAEGKKTGPLESERREFYLLTNGRKIGPYKVEDIEFKVREGELLLTDQISEDEGNHWSRLYDLPHIDLRKHQGNELPTTPSQVVQTPTVVSNVQEQIGLVGDLAKVGIEGEKEKAKRFSELEPKIEKTGKNNSGRFLNIFVLAIIIVIGFYFFERRNKTENTEAPIPVPERTPSSIPPLKFIPKKQEFTPPPLVNKEIKKPKKYPAVPAVPILENDSTESEILEELPLEPIDEVMDEDEKPKKPTTSPRRRSRPKMMEETIDDPGEDILE